MNTRRPNLAQSPELPALPEPDDTISDLAPSVREVLGEIWQTRAEAELATAPVFAHVALSLCGAHAQTELLSLASRASTDEIRHSLICRHLASIYWRRPAPELVPDAIEMPQFGDAPPAVNGLLLVVLQCSVNETIAAALLRAMLKGAANPLVREATRLLLADEVDHARIGWSHLASPAVTPELREHVSRALPALLRIAERVWLLDRPPFAIPVPEGHGHLPDAQRHALTVDAIEHLIFPGFESAGVDTRAGERFWGERRARFSEPL